MMPCAEIIGGELHTWQAVVHVSDSPPLFGALVSVELSDEIELFGLVVQISSQMADTYHVPVPLGGTTAQRAYVYPHTAAYVQYYLTIVVVGFCRQGVMHYRWPEAPPQYHAQVHVVAASRYATLCMRPEYVMLILQAPFPAVQIDEACIAFLSRWQSAGTLTQAHLSSFMEGYVHGVASDYRRIRTLCTRIERSTVDN
jgi:hypothetical protein